MLFCIIFSVTSLTTNAASSTFTVLDGYRCTFGTFNFYADDWESGQITKITSGQSYSPGLPINYEYTTTTTSSTGTYHVTIPLLFGFSSSSSSLTLDLNRYYSICPWVDYSASGFAPKNVYVTDSDNNVFYMPIDNTAYTGSGNPTVGDNFRKIGCGVFYKGVDLLCPDISAWGTTYSSSVKYGKILYLHFDMQSTSKQTNYAITLNTNGWILSIPDNVNNALQNQTTDKQTQTLINQQNQLQQQSNNLQDESNSIAQENSDTNKDTNNKVTSFFSSFFDNLIGVFVPESGFFSQWFSDLNTFMSQKLGFLWSPFDFILSFLNGIYNSSGSQAQIVFPELAWIDGTVIIPRTVFSFDNIGGQSFTDLRDMIYFATDVILLGAVVHQFYQKIKLVFVGGSD